MNRRVIVSILALLLVVAMVLSLLLMFIPTASAQTVEGAACTAVVDESEQELTQPWGSHTAVPEMG